MNNKQLNLLGLFILILFLSSCGESPRTMGEMEIGTPITQMASVTKTSPPTLNPSDTPSPIHTITPVPPSMTPSPVPPGWIYYTAYVGQEHFLYRVAPDGSGLQQIMEFDVTDLIGAISPDGKLVAFPSDREEDRNDDIYVMDLETEVIRRLTTSTSGDGWPRWSPDGKRIVFQAAAGRPTGTDVYVINTDGSSLMPMMKSDFNEGPSTWAPDGKRLVFQSKREEGNSNIFVLEANGDITQLTDDPAAEASPAWSPDGEYITFVSNRGGSVDIYVMNSDGSDVKQLTDDPGQELSPTWSPDGQFIAFQSDRDERFNIYVIKRDGTGLFKIDDPFDSSWEPIWINPQ